MESELSGAEISNQNVALRFRGLGTAWNLGVGLLAIISAA